MSSTVPYIGSKISLVSNSDIRYEGILYTINTQESTIALQSVRCCGTEGRKVPEIPPSSEIYDFIIFRGQDIKDLTVLESANPALSAQLNDPAIMSVNQRPPGSAAGGKAPSGGKGVSSPSPGGYGGGYSGGKGSGTWGGGWQKPDNRSGGQAYRGGGGGGYNAWGNDAYGGGSGGGGSGKGFGGKQKGGIDVAKGGGKGMPKGAGKDKGFKGGDKGGDKGGGKDKGGKGSGKGGGKVMSGKGGGKGGPPGGQGGQGGSSGGGRRSGGGGSGDGVGGTPVGELLPQVNEAEKSKYTEAFDYEGENKKFDKVFQAAEGEEAVDDKLKPLSGYDKGRSFFDNISCEATERAGDAERPKVDRNKAWQNDRETFGDTRRPPRPTGGRRGKGGRRGAPRGYRN
mmetsp:Transcript_44568/g.128940  ORF Transcript_44568/g.128940 Transcript_44568/m.128940 type:complete len:398 (+) Transcript_44568:98-1291(+)